MLTEPVLKDTVFNELTPQLPDSLITENTENSGIPDNSKFTGITEITEIRETEFHFLLTTTDQSNVGYNDSGKLNESPDLEDTNAHLDLISMNSTDNSFATIDNNFSFLEDDQTFTGKNLFDSQNESINSEWPQFSIYENFFVSDQKDEQNIDELEDEREDREESEFNDSDFVFGGSNIFEISIEKTPSKAKTVIKSNFKDLKEKASSAKKKISTLTKSIVVSKLDGSRIKEDQKKIEQEKKSSIPRKTRFLDPYYYPSHNFNPEGLISLEEVLHQFVVPIMKQKERSKVPNIETKKTFVFRPLPGIITQSPSSPISSSPKTSSPQTLPQIVTVTRSRSTSIANVRDNEVKRFLYEAFSNSDDKSHEKKVEESIKAELERVVTESHRDLHQREKEVTKTLRRLKTSFR